jgi:hypothetical protein
MGKASNLVLNAVADVLSHAKGMLAVIFLNSPTLITKH